MGGRTHPPGGGGVAGGRRRINGSKLGQAASRRGMACCRGRTSQPLPSLELCLGLSNCPLRDRLAGAAWSLVPAPSVTGADCCIARGQAEQQWCQQLRARGPGRGRGRLRGGTCRACCRRDCGRA